MKHYTILSTEEFENWYEGQPEKAQVQIMGRLEKIENHGHFGTIKNLDYDLWEMKWQNGRRIYYAYFEKQNILLLLGGNKNGQDKDIRQARKILSERIET